MAKRINYIGAGELMLQQLNGPEFIVEGFLPKGLTIFAGPQKVGKSWMVLDLCSCVANGEPFMGMKTIKGEVAYYCLEDTSTRVRDRLYRLRDESENGLLLAYDSNKLDDGFFIQLKELLSAHPDIKLIVIDTLQKIRSGRDSSYANDYEELSKVKTMADLNNLAIVLVHHTRKQEAADVFDKVSGTTGITGCADTTIVMERDRNETRAMLHITGRDIRNEELVIRFENFKWVLEKRKNEKEIMLEKVPENVIKVAEYIVVKGMWRGTASELMDEVGLTDTKPNILTKQLNQFCEKLTELYNISYLNKRKSDRRELFFSVVTVSDDEKSV